MSGNRRCTPSGGPELPLPYVAISRRNDGRESAVEHVVVLTVEDQGVAPDELTVEQLSRAVRLFDFLAHVQEIRSHLPPPATYGPEDKVLWLHSLPTDSSVRLTDRTGDAGSAAAILAVHRVADTPPPVPPPAVAERLANGFDDPLRPPILSDEIDVPEGSEAVIGPGAR